MTEFRDAIAGLIPDYPWIGEVFLIVLATLAAKLIASLVLNRIEQGTKLTENAWDDIMIAALKKPLSWLIWVFGLSWAVQVAGISSDFDLDDLLTSCREVLSSGLIAWFLVRLVYGIEQHVLQRERTDDSVDPTTVLAIGKLLRTTVVIVAVLIALQSLGLSVSGVLAAGGIGGIAIGFAAKDLLANFFGALMIFLDRPFSVGDWIRSPDKQIEGTVEFIGWRLTRIRTFDKRPLYVPNSTFTQISVENPSRMLNRRIYETVGLRYDDAKQVNSIVQAVHDMLRTHPDIDQNQTLIVNFNAFGASSLDFFIYTFTKTTDWVTFHRIKQDVLLKVLEIIHGHGADVAFPTTTVKLEAEHFS